ncbi:MAG: hypothetical protein ACYS0E_05910 [Planctomycetota bacterium]|jgi:hypothetical protein
MPRLTALLLFGLAACGGGGANGDESALAKSGANSETDVQELFAGCLASDAADLGALLETLQGFFSAGDAPLPQPEFDLLAALISGGVVPYTWDLDGDEIDDLTGTIRFLDQDGNTVIPFDLATLIGGGIQDPLDLLGEIEDGTRLELNYTLGELLLSGGSEASGDGALVFRLAGGTISSIAGSGTFESGACLFDYAFDEIGFDLGNLDGLPVVKFEFDAKVGDDEITGTIDFDGSDTASVTASVNGGPSETFALDLTSP